MWVGPQATRSDGPDHLSRFPPTQTIPRKPTVEIDCLCTGILFADVACSPVDRVPEAGELVAPERIQLGLGGCASNTALDLARLGLKVGASGCVGRDVFGEFIIDELAGGGVDTDGIHRLEGIHTACTMIINVQGQAAGSSPYPAPTPDLRWVISLPSG